MPRPKTCRRICSYPSYWSFAPEDGHCGETVQLMLDEYEAIRLIDHQKMTQEECAEAMGVSRATVTSIYESARAKLADALISGKQLRISGGAYRIDDVPAAAEVPEKEPGTARVAVPYDDGQVGQHRRGSGHPAVWRHRRERPQRALRDGHPDGIRADRLRRRRRTGISQRSNKI